jgi:His-Xaa-Ser system protein HxsD
VLERQRPRSGASVSSFVLSDGVLKATLDLRVYRLSAIKKAAYRVAGTCSVSLGVITHETLPVLIAPKSVLSATEAEELGRMFEQELLDQELREHVADETAGLRSLILAQAYSKTGLIRDE